MWTQAGRLGLRVLVVHFAECLGQLSFLMVCWFICCRKKSYSARSQSLSEAGHASVYPAARRLQWCAEVVACR